MFKTLELELRSRAFSPKTAKAYVYFNQKFLEFIKKKPQQVSQSDIKAYLAYLDSKHSKAATLNLALQSLKFYYCNILGRRFMNLKQVRKDKHIPTVLTKQEVAFMIANTKNVKHRLLIKFLYGSGLRVSECIKLKVNDIDISQRIGIVRQGKGRKDRFFLLSPILINDLNKHLRLRIGDNRYIFNSGQSHISIRTAQMVVKQAAKRANIKKRVFCHALRSSFATHLIESGTGIENIQRLLGHENIKTTQGYIKFLPKHLKGIKSPLDNLSISKKPLLTT